MHRKNRVDNYLIKWCDAPMHVFASAWIAEEDITQYNPNEILKGIL